MAGNLAVVAQVVSSQNTIAKDIDGPMVLDRYLFDIVISQRGAILCNSRH